MQSANPFKNLYRSRTDRVFAGIFGGFGEYWNIDPVVLRVLWILITIFTGFFPGIIAYVVAIFIIPEKPVVTNEERAREETHTA